ncbi:MAG: type II toxin-antitoxin system RelE/ParE family toxin [Hyphomicrobiales bacterium]
MSAKPTVPREQARRDIEEAVDYYAREAGEQIASSFVASVESAYRTISNHPAAGSSRYAYELNLPGLRSRSLKRFPYLVFYVERDDHIDIWRVLHAERDIPAWMHGPENT